MSAVLQTSDLIFGYPSGRLLRNAGPAVKALDRVSVAVEASKVLGIVGESGSGKSTLLRTIVGLNPGYHGSIRFKGEEVNHAGGQRLAAFRAGVQMIFQDPGGSLNPFQTIRRMFAGRFARYPSPVPVGERALALLRSVGMDESALDRLPSEFSGGQLQRLAIARALACDPAVLLCDEPTSALDVSIQAQILDLFIALKAEGRAFIFVTHNLGVLGHIADDIVVMHRGKVVETGPMRHVIQAPVEPYTAALIAASPRLKHRGALLQGARRGAAARIAGQAPARRETGR